MEKPRRHPMLWVFSLFGYEVEICVTPVDLLRDCSWISNLIELQEFAEAQKAIDKARLKWGWSQNLQDEQVRLRWQQFKAQRKQ